MEHVRFTLFKDSSALAIQMEEYLTALNVPFDTIAVDDEKRITAAIVIGDTTVEYITVTPKRGKFQGILGFKIFKRFYPLK